ncbi:type IV secretion system coupling TraD/TrwB family protein [Mucilaginibacter frigoritolerans]|uniref:Type IV secretion system coupling TraD/TrwB family protein n=1 Tax=Mucilaginibacter frigoritolerans TaxID=652788 RepID=A0A562TTD0_9SPHI|nr:type IV secretion system DNA-binding domain-containing protein [Mucilaginibacter frigoritolerans]TWI96825.1 type IV secretion system coupling TraD/TrwB family protein [Mucilaginibacter frigoritolerans]
MIDDYAHSKPFTPIGYTNFRNQQQLFGIKLNDRYSHVYALGKTGSGKTSLLLNMAIDDIYKGYGVALIEPHGDASADLLKKIPEHRKKDVIYFNPGDAAHRTGFNPLLNVPIEDRHLVASELVLAFKKIWGDSWGPRLEYILRYSCLTLLEYPTATLLDIQPLLLDRAYRNMVLLYTDNPVILSFWHNEYDSYTNSFRTEAIMPILNKVGVFSANVILREIVGQQESISLEEIMNSGKILICNLSKGIIGEDVSQILGSLLTTSIQTAAMRRAKVAAHERRTFMVFIDECHSFITTSFATILSEVRKYNVGLFLTHQYIEQLPDEVQSAILGNVGTIICFRLGTHDAKIIADEFYPVFTVDDFINLPRFHMYLRVLIDGVASKPFSAKTQFI